MGYGLWVMGYGLRVMGEVDNGGTPQSVRIAHSVADGTRCTHVGARWNVPRGREEVRPEMEGTVHEAAATIGRAP